MKLKQHTKLKKIILTTHCLQHRTRMCSVSWAQILQVRQGHWDPTCWHCSPFTNPAETTNAFLKWHHALSSLLILQQALTHWHLQGWASQIRRNDGSYRKEADAQKGKGKAGACKEALCLRGRSCSTETLILHHGRGTRESSICWLFWSTERHQECYSSLQSMSLMLRDIPWQQDFFRSNLHFLKGISKIVVKTSLSDSQNQTVFPWQNIFSICENPLFHFQQSLYLRTSF